MKYSDLKKVLKNHKLRITDTRMDVLEYFVKQSKALSFRDLEERFEGCDRVTLYRTLNAFTENGVLHKIPDDSGYATYGVCYDTCTHDHHTHDHMHFKCTACGKITCVDQHIPQINLPGYEIKEANMILSGVCPNCRLN
ncbi:MAG: transcriptional repressor [Flammeovirgaceae bacterium]|nr:transcriptional repressor [Flammeovirgaceae bacterium]MBR07866.1 transcriptional repressor [Rickettsiales bacterium]HCX22749.1 transcriptional repressor [Cytophagales bacterium]